MTQPPINTIIHADSVPTLATFPEEFVDLVFADPPYNLQLGGELWRPNLTKVNPVDEEWDAFSSFAHYDAFTRAWLKVVRRVMKPDASIWISGMYHNIFRVGAIMQDLGFWVLNTVIWRKPNAMPNFRGTRLRNDVEFLIWAKLSEESSYTFNYHTVKRYNEGKQLNSVWEIPITRGAERLKDDDGEKLHPTQKPEALLERIIVMSSRPDDLVLDPFLGSGTTAAVAKWLHRDYIGIELDANYAAAARERVAGITPLPADHPKMRLKTRPPRVPFHELVDKGYLQPGQKLTLDHPNRTATITEDAQLRWRGLIGSIHKVGARLKKTPTCNGWMHWYYEADGQRHKLDTLREIYREEWFE